jgi:GNAT superfamily N-acetyltransferase
MTERNMQEHYINSGVGWDTKVEEEEIQDPSSRFILAHNLDNQDGFNIIGFVHFKFTMQGELFNEMIGDPCVFINTIQIDAAFRRMNLGKHLLQTIEFIAKKNSMNYVMFTIPKTCDEARHFFTDKGYDYDGMVYEEGMMVEDPEDVDVMTKCISTRILEERAKGSEVQDFARMLAEQMANAKRE